ncbi:hypothetical protein GCM10023225_00800 [Kineococcus glutinatus]|uniref:Uncharacterized protein n=1 Tax=Kineococcus glutinatus TaxID=1070872 RepID=A0ABP9H5A7_9ACTN
MRARGGVSGGRQRQARQRVPGGTGDMLRRWRTRAGTAGAPWLSARIDRSSWSVPEPGVAQTTSDRAPVSSPGVRRVGKPSHLPGPVVRRQAVRKFAIIAMSSCSRLWQCSMNVPAWSPNRTSTSTA